MNDGKEKETETKYRIGQDNITPFGLDIHNPVFFISGISVVAFVLLSLMFKEQAAEFFGWLRPAITSTFDWFFLLSANIFVLFCVILGYDKKKRILNSNNFRSILWYTRSLFSWLPFAVCR